VRALFSSLPPRQLTETFFVNRKTIPGPPEALLKTADGVSIHCCLNDETREMFDDRAFARMKPSAGLINTARGEVVDESALIRALKAGRIAGAGLDVTVKDPLPEDDPLRDAPHTILTGHGAWYSTRADSPGEFWQKAMGQVALALQGRWPTYPANPEIKSRWMKRWGVSTTPGSS